MKIVEREWKYGKYLAYEDVEEELIPTTKGVRVLPAQFYYEKKLYFELWRKYEPGDKPTFPNGGYEVVDMSGGIRSYNLDQVIIHPSIIQHKKMVEKMAKRSEKQQLKYERMAKKRERDARKVAGKRGRKPLTDEERQQRELVRKEAGARSGGKRGRPKSTEPKVVVAKVGGGKRGRPPLSQEAKAAKELAVVQRKMKSGGKRGRPSKRK